MRGQGGGGGREEGVVLDEEPEAVGHGLSGLDLAPAAPEPRVRQVGGGAVVVQAALELDGGGAALGEDALPRLGGEVPDAGGGTLGAVHASVPR